MYKRFTYYRNIVSLIGIILLLIIFIAMRPYKIKMVEIPREIIKEVEKEIVIEIEKEPAYAYHITSKEREMLARLVYLEANTEGLECQKAVVSVVINRWQSGKWGETLQDVVYSPYQFTPSNLIYKTTPVETNYEAVDYVIKYGSILPSYCMYFRADYHFNWGDYKPHKQIGQVCFGYLEADKNEG